MTDEEYEDLLDDQLFDNSRFHFWIWLKTHVWLPLFIKGKKVLCPKIKTRTPQEIAKGIDSNKDIVTMSMNYYDSMTLAEKLEFLKRNKKAIDKHLKK